MWWFCQWRHHVNAFISCWSLHVRLVLKNIVSPFHKAAAVALTTPILWRGVYCLGLRSNGSLDPPRWWSHIARLFPFNIEQ